MVVQTLYFGLCYWLLLLFPHMLIYCGKHTPFFLSVFCHPKHLEAAACVPGNQRGKVAVHWCTWTFYPDTFGSGAVERQYSGYWGCYLQLELHCQFASWLGDVRLSILTSSRSGGELFCSCLLQGFLCDPSSPKIKMFMVSVSWQGPLQCPKHKSITEIVAEQPCVLTLFIR